VVLIGCYSEIRHQVYFARSYIGDADQLAPSLFTDRAVVEGSNT
jgi:hypothetical protein